MYIVIKDVIGEKRISLAYPIQGKEVTVVSMLSDNVQYWLKEPMKILLITGEEMMLKKGVYMDKKLNAIMGLELKSRMDYHDYVLRSNKLENIMGMAITLEELDNSNNLEDGIPSNTLFMYYVTGAEYSTRFNLETPQYKKLKDGKTVSLTLRITDQNNNLITDEPGMTVVLHVR